MTQAMDFETDEKLKLLTDALRAGPGSPEWRAAIAEIQAHASAAGEDEHQLLLRVREHLASGRSYREIRAGAGFTRKVIEGIEREAEARPRLSPNANWIAVIAAVAIISVVAVVAFMVWPTARNGPGAPGDGGLERTKFVETTESITFDDSIGADWQTFGFLTLTADGGLKPMSMESSGGKDYRGGGIYWDRQIPADEPVSVEATMMLQKGSGDGVVQLFVTDSREFETKSATSPRELVVYLKDGEAKVALPDGSVVGQGTKLKDVKQNVDVRLAMNQKDAVVEVNQQRVWAGEHHLPADRARTIGLRFLVAGNEVKDQVSVQSLRVMQLEKKEGSALRAQDSGR